MKNKKISPVHIEFEDLPNYDHWIAFDAGRYILAKQNRESIESSEVFISANSQSSGCVQVYLNPTS